MGTKSATSLPFLSLSLSSSSLFLSLSLSLSVSLSRCSLPLSRSLSLSLSFFLSPECGVVIAFLSIIKICHRPNLPPRTVRAFVSPPALCWSCCCLPCLLCLSLVLSLSLFLFLSPECGVVAGLSLCVHQNLPPAEFATSDGARPCFSFGLCWSCCCLPCLLCFDSRGPWSFGWGKRRRRFSGGCRTTRQPLLIRGARC